MKFISMKEAAADHILTVAHRGSFAGNIPCNTIPAYECALRQGADMIEVDVDMTKDGKLVIFHPGMEPVHLYTAERIPRLTSEEVSRLRYVNYDRTPTQFGVESFDDVLERFKDRCYINVDKFWGHPKEIYEAIKAHGMQDQVLVKSDLKPNVLTVLEEVAPDLPFAPIVSHVHPEHEALKNRKIRYEAVEVLFDNEADEVASEAFLEKMHRDGILVWVNAIIYNYRKQLAGGHSDDTSVVSSPDDGWGWLARHGFDFIQTDWPLVMTGYLKEKGLLYRS